MLHHPKRAGMGVGWDFPNPGQPPERSCTQGVRSVCLLGPVLGSVGQFWGSFALVRAVGHRWWPIGPYGADPSGAAEPPMPPWVPQIEPDSQAIASCLVQPRITTYFRRGPLRAGTRTQMHGAACGCMRHAGACTCAHVAACTCALACGCIPLHVHVGACRRHVGAWRCM